MSLRAWIDAQLPPVMAAWLAAEDGIQAEHTFDLGLLGASDITIFEAARAATAIVVTKDADFVELLERRGPPPQIVWITSGNTSNAALRVLIDAAWPRCVASLRDGEPFIELGDRR